MANVKVILLFLPVILGTHAIPNHFRSPRQAGSEDERTQCPPDYSYTDHLENNQIIDTVGYEDCYCDANNPNEEVVTKTIIKGLGDTQSIEYVCPQSLETCIDGQLAIQRSDHLKTTLCYCQNGSEIDDDTCDLPADGLA